MQDQDILIRHCIQAALLVGSAAPVVSCAQIIWRRGIDDTDFQQLIFRMLGAFLIMLAPSIVVQYIAPDQSGEAAGLSLFAAGGWFFLALPVMRFARKQFGRKGAI